MRGEAVWDVLSCVWAAASSPVVSVVVCVAVSVVVCERCEGGVSAQARHSSTTCA